MPLLTNPTVAKYWVAHSADGSVIHSGIVPEGGTIQTPLEVLRYYDDEQGQLDYLNSLVSVDNIPATGELCQANFDYKSGGTAYKCRVEHDRVAGDPATQPDLWSAVRPAGTYQDWTASESVFINTRRTYQGVTYECIQSHTTQPQWTPDVALSLWRVFVEPVEGEWAPRIKYDIDDEAKYLTTDYICIQAHTSQVGWEPTNVLGVLWNVKPVGDEWQVGVFYNVNDEVTYQGPRYRCIQAHTSQIGWEPPNVPALWQAL